MPVDLQSIPTSNTLEFAVTFFNGTQLQATLRFGEAQTLNFRFDSIGIGNGEPLSMYVQEIPGNITIPPGNLAFVDRSVNSKIALRYGTPGGVQQNIIYVLQ